MHVRVSLFTMFFVYFYAFLGLYLYECNKVGVRNGESSGQVYIQDKKVDVSTFVSLYFFKTFVFISLIVHARGLGYL